MRKLLAIVFTLAALPAISQTPKKTYDLANRAADHLMIQLSSDHWTGVPDSINSHKGGLSRGANVYFMIDKPFKGNQKMSIAFGLGVSTSNIFFKKMIVDIGSVAPLLPFRQVDSSNNYKKFKLATAYLEVPLELRFTSNPELPNKALKIAIGVKGGLMLNAHTKGKILRTASGDVINNFTQKVTTKSYFNTSRLSATARVGYGNFSLFGSYSFNSLFKVGVAPDIKLLQVGLTLSGL
jgi:hypothetical protein